MDFQKILPRTNARGLKLAMADNIQSSQPFYSTLCAILNWQFHLNYLVLTICKNLKGKGDHVA